MRRRPQFLSFMLWAGLCLTAMLGQAQDGTDADETGSDSSTYYTATIQKSIVVHIPTSTATVTLHTGERLVGKPTRNGIEIPVRFANGNYGKVIIPQSKSVTMDFKREVSATVNQPDGNKHATIHYDSRLYRDDGIEAVPADGLKLTNLVRTEIVQTNKKANAPYELVGRVNYSYTATIQLVDETKNIIFTSIPDAEHPDRKPGAIAYSNLRDFEDTRTPPPGERECIKAPVTKTADMVLQSCAAAPKPPKSKPTPPLPKKYAEFVYGLLGDKINNCSTIEASGTPISNEDDPVSHLILPFLKDKKYGNDKKGTEGLLSKLKKAYPDISVAEAESRADKILATDMCARTCQAEMSGPNQQNKTFVLATFRNRAKSFVHADGTPNTAATAVFGYAATDPILKIPLINVVTAPSQYSVWNPKFADKQWSQLRQAMCPPKQKGETFFPEWGKKMNEIRAKTVSTYKDEKGVTRKRYRSLNQAEEEEYLAPQLIEATDDPANSFQYCAKECYEMVHDIKTNDSFNQRTANIHNLFFTSSMTNKCFNGMKMKSEYIPRILASGKPAAVDVQKYCENSIHNRLGLTDFDADPQCRDEATCK